MSSGFDPVSYFNQQFDLLRQQVASNDTSEALRATIKPKLLTLLRGGGFFSCEVLETFVCGHINGTDEIPNE